MDNFDLRKFLAEGKLSSEMQFDSDIEGKTNKNDFAFWYRAGARGKAQALKAQELLQQNGIDADYSKGPFYIDFSNAGVEQRVVHQMLRDAGLTNFVISNVSEGQLNEGREGQFDVATTERIAQQVADAFTAEDNELDLKYVVSPGVEAGHFDLDVEAGPNTPGEDWKDENGFSIDNYLGQYAGGSFMIKDGIVINAAMRSAPVAKVSPEGEIEMISAEDSRAAIGMDDEIDMDRYNDELDMDRYNDELDMKRMEENEMLDEGLIDKIKEKIVAKVDKIKSKFSAEEIAKMKAVAEKAIGKSAEEVTMADFTMDNIKKVGKAISALNEEEQIEEGLGEKIQGLGAGLGLPAMFVGGHMAMASAAGGVEAFIAGAIALVVGLIGGAIVKSMDEAQEAPKSNKMKKSELKEMIRAAMLAEMEVEETEVMEAEEEEVADEIELEDTEEVDVEMDADVEVDGIDVKQDADAELGGVKGDVQDNLEAALEAAKKLGDDKLVDQIGNSLTFFTRQHVVKEGDMIEDEAEMGLEEAKENLNESIEFPMWNKIK